MAHGLSPDSNGTPGITALEDEWKMENQNLLNNPELLYQECSIIPLLDESRESNEAFWEAAKLTNELILDHNFIMEAIHKKEDIIEDLEGAQETISGVLNQYERDHSLNLDALRQLQEMPVWCDKIKKEIFSHSSTALIDEWKQALNEFLDNYQKIRDCVPDEDASQRSDDEGTSLEDDKDKEQCKYVLCAVEEVDTLLSVVGSDSYR